jgi:hypothetical protein
MSNKNNIEERTAVSHSVRGSDFRINGCVQLEAMERLPSDMKLNAYAFDSDGQLLGASELDPKGIFSVPVKLAQPANVEIVIGPADDPQTVRKSSAYSQMFSAKEWIGKGGKFRLNPDIFLPHDIWRLWWPMRVCVSGHVRKVQTEDGQTEICPVPFVKVEVFDVDREGCLWPLIRRWWDVLVDRPVFRVPDLIKEPPRRFIPEPGPIPDPIGPISHFGAKLVRPGDAISFNPQPEPPYGKLLNLRETVSLGPQPEPPDMPLTKMAEQPVQTVFSRVGETRMIAPSLASRLDNLTLTSKIAPWVIFPWCFYSKQIVCETTTDENGYYRCCFRWWPFHVRRGRLRFDSRPDIIIRVTQVTDGVETVVHMDPYTSTRWNVANAHIDLWLDDEDVHCGSGDEQERPEGMQTFFTRIGDTEVYRITQSNGLYEVPPHSNLAFGAALLIHGQFGDGLSDNSPARYYRLSCAKHGSPDSAFTSITTVLSDTRVNKATSFSESHNLGPKTVNGVPALYEVRDTEHYLWYNPDKIGTWHTWLTEPDTGKYVLRLEVFDENGNKLPSVDYRDGTAPPNGVLPSMIDHSDLVITLDNKPPERDLQILKVINECGVIPWSSVPPLDFDISVSQENGRLHSWGLQYTKGVNQTVHVLQSHSSNNGAPSAVNTTISGAPLLLDPGTSDGKLDSTCAFALKLWARAHITDGRSTSWGAYPRFIYYREQIKAIAIEKCP